MSNEIPHDEAWNPLVDSVTEGVDPTVETAALERTAAALHAGLLLERGLEPMPRALHGRLMASIPGKRPQQSPAPILRPDFGSIFRLWGGWMAAAACLMLAVTVGMRRFGGRENLSAMTLKTRIEELERHRT